MNVTAKLDIPRLKTGLQRLEETLESRAMAAAIAMKRTGRDRIKAHIGPVLGQGVARAWFEKHYPTHTTSLRPAVEFRSKAPEIIDAHDKGALIRATGGRLYLAIPNLAVTKTRTTPIKWQAKTGIKLYMPPSKGGRIGGVKVLLADMRAQRGKQSGRFAKAKQNTRSGKATVIVFWLVPQVRLKKRLDLDGLATGLATTFAADLQSVFDKPTTFRERV